jgi:hypothetical protein
MLEKNIEKEKRKHRKLWNGYYARLTKSKKEKIENIENKYKKEEEWE